MNKTPVAPGPNTLLLVWDAPNIDMGLGAILGGRPTAAHRPRFDAIGRWVLAKAGELAHRTQVHIDSEPTVFTNITPNNIDPIRPWVEALRNIGFAVFAKPKTTEETDVDPDMVEHIRHRHAEGVLRGIIVASADGQNFRELLEELAADGIDVTILGFQEHASWAVNSDFNFVDLEDIPGVFREPLPRINLDNLPAGGAWLEPFRSLATLL